MSEIVIQGNVQGLTKKTNGEFFLRLPVEGSGNDYVIYALVSQVDSEKVKLTAIQESISGKRNQDEINPFKIEGDLFTVKTKRFGRLVFEKQECLTLKDFKERFVNQISRNRISSQTLEMQKIRTV